MMISAVQKLFDKCREIAVSDLLRDDELQFQVIFLTRDDKLIRCVADMPDAYHERDALVSLLRLLAVAYDAVAAGIIAEVWIDPDCQDGRRPSESPNRYEAILVSVVYRDDGGMSLVQSEREILRDSTGKIVELRAPEAPSTPQCCDEFDGSVDTDYASRATFEA